MKEFFKKNLTLILAFALPVGLIITVTIISYSPPATTEYDFVYSYCTEGINNYPYYCEGYLGKIYSVENDKLSINPVNPKQDSDYNGVPDIQQYTPHIFIHDTKNNESREISLEEARSLKLSGFLTSPDGVTITSGYYDRGIFPFYNGSSYDFYIIKDKKRSKLNLFNQNNLYRENFNFIGWVLSNQK
ncbi:MAG: hypothetical protein COV29_01410 [Candidatus Yanofskybacteria bacterium CG10_big_fil_rev_8_21_14_0_10_36_16]|uniref:Uncharacterized protein n=1 Tax=Candidatus Yanofskybacteria bacterium CG10_big_fil_rev_8_21_14_0_10_36_16 TaxID=1975096 RepID=A0A2J0Q768_9BACT|nr:MAG: hypothetical protein COV29_01410 [Candidatus Yanofskybacteria bacterium CG10_big_fil_rev_8_21_14_0_10_36_16]